MTVSWIIGGNGLLGSALGRELNKRGDFLFTPAERFRWDSEPELVIQLEVAVKSFAALVGDGDKWQIYWAAGVGRMSSARAELALETQTLSTLLGFVETEPGLIKVNGCFALASSAGAIYAGETGDVICENTAITPTTAYAHEKLNQEKIVSSFALNNSGVTALLARISTLYGPNQGNGKRQGLISNMACCILRNQPIQIFVPFDTIRDYIIADDAAAVMIASMRTIDRKSGVFTKIIASEKPTTIAEIVSVFKRVTRRTPRIVSSASKLSEIYTRRIQFRSIAIPGNEQLSMTSLLVGIAQVMAAERSAYSRSR